MPAPFPIDSTDRVLVEPAAEIIVYTRAWSGDRPADDENPVNCQVHSRIVLNGREVAGTTGITVDAHGGEFVTARLGLLVQAIHFIPLSDEDFEKAELPPVWPAL